LTRLERRCCASKVPFRFQNTGYCVQEATIFFLARGSCMQETPFSFRAWGSCVQEALFFFQVRGGLYAREGVGDRERRLLHASLNDAPT
jgi:hypothetical protein